MTPSILGPWLILALGAVCIVAAIFSSFKKVAPKIVLMAWIFGFGLLGVGSYGPVFLSDYAKVLQALKAWETSPTEGNRALALEEVSGAKISEESRRAVVRYILSTGGDQAVETLDEVILKTPQDSSGRKVLAEARDELEAERGLYDLARRHLEEEEAEPEAEDTEKVAALLRLPDERLQAYNLDRPLLEKMIISREAIASGPAVPGPSPP